MYRCWSICFTFSWLSWSFWFTRFRACKLGATVFIFIYFLYTARDLFKSYTPWVNIQKLLIFGFFIQCDAWRLLRTTCEWRSSWEFKNLDFFCILKRLSRLRWHDIRERSWRPSKSISFRSLTFIMLSPLYSILICKFEEMFF